MYKRHSRLRARPDTSEPMWTQVPHDRHVRRQNVATLVQSSNPGCVPCPCAVFLQGLLAAGPLSMSSVCSLCSRSPAFLAMVTAGVSGSAWPALGRILVPCDCGYASVGGGCMTTALCLSAVASGRSEQSGFPPLVRQACSYLHLVALIVPLPHECLRAPRREHSLGAAIRVKGGGGSLRDCASPARRFVRCRRRLPSHLARRCRCQDVGAIGGSASQNGPLLCAPCVRIAHSQNTRGRSPLDESAKSSRPLRCAYGLGGGRSRGDARY